MFNGPQAIVSEGERLTVREVSGEPPNGYRNTYFIEVKDQAGFAVILEISRDVKAFHWRRTSPCCAALMMANRSHSAASCSTCWASYPWTFQDRTCAAYSPNGIMKPFIPACEEIFKEWYSDALDPLTAELNALSTHTACQAFSLNFTHHAPDLAHILGIEAW